MVPEPGRPAMRAAERTSKEQAPPRPRVLILATGGTITSQVSSALTKEYDAAGVRMDTLLRSATGTGAPAQVSCEHIASIGSQDMTVAIWRRIHERITETFAQKLAEAVVVTHGTDTLEETAFFLDLVTPLGSPVVLVGAMRPSNAPGADGPANLIEAIRVAIDPASANRGVLVVLNDAVHAARSVRKAHTSEVDAFRSSAGGPIGMASASSVHYFGSAAAPGVCGAYRLPENYVLPRIGVLYAHVDMDALAVDALVQQKVTGIVLAGVGDGNAPSAVLGALAGAAQQGIVVVRSTRVEEGFVNRNVEIDDDRLGFVIARDLSPQKSRILLQLLIAGGVTGSAAIQRAFNVE